jgi:fumarate reductase subunit C
MKEANYTLHHPRWYRRRVSVWWWLESWRYTKFVLRELTSLAVAYFALLALWKVRAIAAGPAAYESFLVRMQSPWFLLVNAAALAAVLFHSVTWFNLAPKAMVVRVGGRRLPDWMIQAGNYAAWIALSVFAVWVLRRS